ncbi:MAG: ribokinase [Planctomycetaceae bacterium]|nr:ribokinase [Planctomycetaceae bacterium]
MSKTIIVVGSSNTDMVIKSQKIPAPGETVIGGEFFSAPGGKGANQAVAVARLGGNVTFIAKVGTDMFGDKAIEGYRKEGINTDLILRDPEHATGVALILVDADGENLISVASGANEFLKPADIERSETLLAAAKVIVTQLETPLDVLETTARIAKKYKVPLVLDPAPAKPIPKEILKQITYIKPNENEATVLTGIAVKDVESAKAAGQWFLDAGVQAAVITLGREGAVVVQKDSAVHLPGYSVKAVDSTAAGDAFSGALCFGLARGEELLQAAKTASAAAAISVTRAGAQPSLPTPEELKAFLKDA